jgi:hypothetical protein
MCGDLNHVWVVNLCNPPCVLCWRSQSGLTALVFASHHAATALALLEAGADRSIRTKVRAAPS